jgi:CxxC motif-containing protein (DUF1111 family)
MCQMKPERGRSKTRQCWGPARPSAFDEGRVPTSNFHFPSRVTPRSIKAPGELLFKRRAWLVGAIAFGAALPLLVGGWQSYGADADAAVKTLLPPTTDFTKLEEGEAKPGGGATSRGSVDNANAFSLSSGNMDFMRELDFKIGNGIFRKNCVSAPSSTDASDGLGPLFNSRACQNCHLKDGRGHPPLSSDVPDDSGSMLVRLSVPAATEEKAKLAAYSSNSIPDPTYGGQLQNFSIQGFKPEGQLKIAYKEHKVKLAGGESVSLRTPSYSLTDLWGIGLTKIVSGHTLFLHDGRARNLTEAILWHGGEAQASRDAFTKLSKADRDALIAFVSSL